MSLHVAALVAALTPAAVVQDPAAAEPAAQEPATEPRTGARPGAPQPSASQTIPEVLIEAPQPGAGGVLTVPPLDYAAGRDVIAPAEIEKAGTMNLQEVLRRSPNIVVSEETGSDSLPNIGLRGVTGNDGFFRAVDVSLLADGIPLVSAPYGQPGASLFPFTLERVYAIDVMKGGTGVRYGPNNVAGVINFLSRPIPERPTIELGVKYDEFHDGSIYHSYGATHDRFGYLAEFVYKDGETFRDHGDYTIQNYSIKSAYQYTPTQRGILQVEYFEDDSDLSDGLSKAAYEADPSQSLSKQNRFEGQQTRYNYKHEMQLGADTRADVITYYYTGRRGFFLGNPLHYGETANFVQATPRPSEVWAVQPQIAHRYEIGAAAAEVLFGLRVHDEDIKRSTERYFPDGTDLVTARARYDYTAYTAFVENTFFLDRWRITPGVRVEAIEIDARDVLADVDTVERDMTEVLPAISASYLVDDQWSLFANAQASYQPPGANVIELGPDPQDVEAQSAWLYEVGTRFQSLDGRTAADLTVYRIDYRERLEPDPDQFDVFLNTGESVHQGVELAIDRDLGRGLVDGARAWASVAYNDSEYEDGEFAGNDLPGTPRWILSWGVRYDHEPTGLGAGIDGFFVDSYYSDRENTVEIAPNGTRGEVPSRIVWNAQADWRHALTDELQLTLAVSARNLFDEEYFDTRAGRGIYPGAPFHLGAALSLKWVF